MNEKNDVLGINSENLKKLILKTNDYAEKTKNILTEYNDLVQENMQYFQCECKKNFITIHNENKFNFPIFEKNIFSYSKDLLTVKNNYHIGTKAISFYIKQETKKNFKNKEENKWMN